MNIEKIEKAWCKFATVLEKETGQIRGLFELNMAPEMYEKIAAFTPDLNSGDILYKSESGKILLWGTILKPASGKEVE